MLYEAFWLLRLSREALSKILIVSLWSKLWNKSSLWGYWDLLWASMNPFRYFYHVDQLYTFCIEWVIRTKALICNVPANWLQHFKGVLTLAPKLLWHTKLEQTACCELVFVISKDGAEMFKGSAVLSSFAIIILLIDPGCLAAGLLEDVKMLPTPVTSQIQSKNT